MKQTKTMDGAVTPGQSFKSRGNYSHAKLDIKLDQRRHDADNRERIYDGMTTKEKIAYVNKRNVFTGGNSKRELTKLNKLLQEENLVKTPPAIKQNAAKTNP